MATGPSALREAHRLIQNLIDQYETFLSKTDAPEEELVTLFMDKHKRKEHFGSAYEFGNSVFEVLNTIGEQSLFHRLLVV